VEAVAAAGLTPLATDTTAAQARESAQRILSERRFHGGQLPDPLRGVLKAIGDALAAVGRAIDHAISSLLGGSGNGIGLPFVLVAAVVLGISIWLATRSVRRRAAAGASAEEAAATAGEADAGSLERRADAAEQAGDYASAVRLRFRAGLLRLDERGAVAVTSSTTTREVARALRSRDFDLVAAGFDRVAYGDAEPEPADADLQRSGWRRILETTGRRR
jgi:hypothetical protein